METGSHMAMGSNDLIKGQGITVFPQRFGLP
jgi:hypothetical protein